MILLPTAPLGNRVHFVQNLFESIVKGNLTVYWVILHKGFFVQAGEQGNNCLYAQRLIAYRGVVRFDADVQTFAIFIFI